MNIRLMSYNITHCESELTHEIDFEGFADTIRRYDPDVVGLNEVYEDGENGRYGDQAHALARLLGYHCYFARATEIGGRYPYGNALLSRYPILAARTISVPDPVKRGYNGYYETRCVLKAAVAVGRGLTVCVTHFGLNPDEQENAVKTVLPAVELKRCVLMGDLNVTPDNPVLEPLRETLTDTAAAGTGSLLSWPSPAPDRKIDYIFCSGDLKPVHAEVPAELISDHRPYVAQIEDE